jgi:hypothetical protein
LQSCLGLEIDGIKQTVQFKRPLLPTSVAELRIHNLSVGTATVDLLVVNHREGVGVNVLRQEGRAKIRVIK